jgi:hypothetical protein
VDLISTIEAIRKKASKSPFHERTDSPVREEQPQTKG